MKYFLLLFAVGCGVAIAVAKPAGQPADKNDTTHDAMAGIRLGGDEGKALEEQVAKKPDDIGPGEVARLLLYERQNSVAAKEAYRGHVLWIIKNRPESEIAGSPFCGMDPVTDSDGFHDAKQLWLEQVKEHEKDAAIVGNAAVFYSFTSKNKQRSC